MEYFVNVQEPGKDAASLLSTVEVRDDAGKPYIFTGNDLLAIRMDPISKDPPAGKKSYYAYRLEVEHKPSGITLHKTVAKRFLSDDGTTRLGVGDGGRNDDPVKVVSKPFTGQDGQTHYARVVTMPKYLVDTLVSMLNQAEQLVNAAV